MSRQKLGQHFLKSKYYIEKIINSIELSPPSNILEIGPGNGSITFPLIDSGFNLIGIEKDKKFEKCFKNKDILIYYEDAIFFPENIENFLKEKKIEILISNLPYNAGTKIFLRYLPNLKYLKQMILMFQKEVGEKISARTGSSSFGSLSVITKLLSDVKVLFKIPPDAFSPKPEVSSILLSFKTKGEFDFSYDKFLKFLGFCFKHPRKTLYNNLLENYKKNIIENMFEENKIIKNSRAHQLEPEVFLKLFRFMGNKNDYFLE